jgi:hypothetical protein
MLPRQGLPVYSIPNSRYRGSVGASFYMRRAPRRGEIWLGGSLAINRMPLGGVLPIDHFHEQSIVPDGTFPNHAKSRQRCNVGRKTICSFRDECRRHVTTTRKINPEIHVLIHIICRLPQSQAAQTARRHWRVPDAPFLQFHPFASK